MKPVAYFEADGSYNEREHKPHKRQPQMYDDLHLDFDKPLPPQVEGKVSPEQAGLIARMHEAYDVLLSNGALPGNWGFRMQRQIKNKIIRCMAAYRKQIVREFEP